MHTLSPGCDLLGLALARASRRRLLLARRAGFGELQGLGARCASVCVCVVRGLTERCADEVPRKTQENKRKQVAIRRGGAADHAAVITHALRWILALCSAMRIYRQSRMMSHFRATEPAV